jgi:hypothetical protein
VLKKGKPILGNGSGSWSGEGYFTPLSAFQAQEGALVSLHA